MVARPQLELDDPPIIKVESAEAARALVARELPHHSDIIKVWFIHRAGEDLAAQEGDRRGDRGGGARGARQARGACDGAGDREGRDARGRRLLLHRVFSEPIYDELVQTILAHHVLVCELLGEHDRERAGEDGCGGDSGEHDKEHAGEDGRGGDRLLPVSNSSDLRKKLFAIAWPRRRGYATRLSGSRMPAARTRLDCLIPLPGGSTAPAAYGKHPFVLLMRS